MAMDYQTLSADQLLATLEQAGRTPDLHLIHACLDLTILRKCSSISLH